jgi:hypothetical protein
MKSLCQGDVGFGLGHTSERLGGQSIQKTMIADLARELETIVEISLRPGQLGRLSYFSTKPADQHAPRFRRKNLTGGIECHS